MSATNVVSVTDATKILFLKTFSSGFIAEAVTCSSSDSMSVKSAKGLTIAYVDCNTSTSSTWQDVGIKCEHLQSGQAPVELLALALIFFQLPSAESPNVRVTNH